MDYPLSRLYCGLIFWKFSDRLVSSIVILYVQSASCFKLPTFSEYMLEHCGKRKNTIVMVILLWAPKEYQFW
ncbi:hypothetical protein RJT34_13503 [Clitoria ternatea]|uniref:Uncharacterized protein n=1 Tax=Clitoria ternatea TaxID=43366 RepID=A0AAN9JR66_CLITE